MQTQTLNPYRVAAAALDLDGRAARVMMKHAARRRALDIRDARRAKAAAAARAFASVAFA